jgi:hypothetical protein
MSSLGGKCSIIVLIFLDNIFLQSNVRGSLVSKPSFFLFFCSFVIILAVFVECVILKMEKISRAYPTLQQFILIDTVIFV